MRGPDGLPAGWKAVSSHSRPGWTCYENLLTGERQGSFPTGPASAKTFEWEEDKPGRGPGSRLSLPPGDPRGETRDDAAARVRRRAATAWEQESPGPGDFEHVDHFLPFLASSSPFDRCDRCDRSIVQNSCPAFCDRTSRVTKNGCSRQCP